MSYSLHPILQTILFLSLVSAVVSESTDATKSIATGNGLQYSTSGVLAQFTVTAKDESGVRRTSGGDEFIVELEGTRSISGAVIDNLDGTYPVSYTPTKSGNYEAAVKLAKSGGLAGSYFENVWFFYTPVKTTVNPTINLDWGTGPITETGMDYVSVRWQGKVKPQYFETHTFFVSSDDGAKLWVDNVLLIDRWDSMNNDTSATIALRPHVFYNIRLDYKEITGTAFIRLSWQSQSTPKEIIPAAQLYYETHVKQSPFSLFVSPNVADGERSTAAGEGLGLATAGTAAQLTLQANDMYDNERGEGEDIFSVRVFPPSSIEIGATGRPVHAVVVDESDSSYTAEYTTYKSGDSTLYASLLVAGGVQATYYDGNDFTSPVKYAEKTTALQSVQFKSTVATNDDYSVATVDGFSVRYVGHVAPPSDSTFTFTWDRPDGVGSSASWSTVAAVTSTTEFTLAANASQAVGAYVGMCVVVDADGSGATIQTATIASNSGSGVITIAPAFPAITATATYYITPCGEDRVRLWVDNYLVIDQWSSLATGDPSGTIDLRANYYYDVRVDYKMVSGCTSGECLLPSADLKWSYGAVPSTALTSTDLFRGYDVMDMPTTVDVNPAGTSASKSFAVPNQAAAGHSLELATAGLQSEFTITAKDLYGNLRNVGGEKFKVRLSGVDSLAGVVEDLAPSNPGAYRVLYTHFAYLL